jgi:hypothetical protein
MVAQKKRRGRDWDFRLALGRSLLLVTVQDWTANRYRRLKASGISPPLVVFGSGQLVQIVSSRLAGLVRQQTDAKRNFYKMEKCNYGIDSLVFFVSLH